MANNHLQFHLQQLNPPVPPQAVALASDPVPLEVRRLRVAHGSRRKRDLAAVAMAEELERLERLLGAPGDRCAALRAWIPARRALRHSLPRSTYQLWIRPLRPVGIDGTTLTLTGPEGPRRWAERRYTALIVEALEGFDRVEFVGGVG